MATYLMVKHSNTTHSIKAKDEEPNKPYIKIKNGYFPLTTETANATGVFVKNGSQVYKIAQTYTTTIQSSSTYRSDYQTTRSSQYTQSNSSSGNVGTLNYYRMTTSQSSNGNSYSQFNMSYTFTKVNTSPIHLCLGKIASEIEQYPSYAGISMFRSMTSITSTTNAISGNSRLDLGFVSDPSVFFSSTSSSYYYTTALLFRRLRYTTTNGYSYSTSFKNFSTWLGYVWSSNSTYSLFLTCTSFRYATSNSSRDSNNYKYSERQSLTNATIYYTVSIRDTLTRESQYNASSEATSYYTVETTSE